MRRAFCHGVASTSTQQHAADAASSSFLTVGGAPQPHQLTLEQMILQLDLEEAKAAAAAARKERCRCSHHAPRRRMSCVDGADRHVLRAARDALSEYYPRFSLDGRRASFSSCYHDAAAGMMPMPDTVAGERVVWREPGVVAKLMGLDAVPVPVRARPRGAVGAARGKAHGPPPPLAETKTGSGGFDGVWKQIRPRRTMGREELEKERLFMALHGYGYGYGYDVAAEAGACHAGGQRRTAVGPNVSRFGREGHRWEFRFPS